MLNKSLSCSLAEFLRGEKKMQEEKVKKIKATKMLRCRVQKIINVNMNE